MDGSTSFRPSASRWSRRGGLSSLGRPSPPWLCVEHPACSLLSDRLHRRKRLCFCGSSCGESHPAVSACWSRAYLHTRGCPVIPRCSSPFLCLSVLLRRCSVPWASRICVANNRFFSLTGYVPVTRPDPSDYTKSLLPPNMY